MPGLPRTLALATVPCPFRIASPARRRTLGGVQLFPQLPPRHPPRLVPGPLAGAPGSTGAEPAARLRRPDRPTGVTGAADVRPGQRPRGHRRPSRPRPAARAPARARPGTAPARGLRPLRAGGARNRRPTGVGEGCGDHQRSTGPAPRRTAGGLPGRRADVAVSHSCGPCRGAAGEHRHARPVGADPAPFRSRGSRERASAEPCRRRRGAGRAALRASRHRPLDRRVHRPARLRRRGCLPSDLGLLKAPLWGPGGIRARELAARAEAWRPWRAYAAIYLWHDYAGGG